MDALLFPLVAALCLDALEKGVLVGLITEEEAAPVTDLGPEIRLVRDMISHIAEYDVGQGRFPARDDKSFDGVFRAADGRIFVGRRLEVVRCNNGFVQVASTLAKRRFWPNSKAPQIDTL